MKYYCNPLNLPYQYQLSVRDGVDTAFREAADPSLVLFQGKYWLFPSMTGGFFTSTDLCGWEFHPFTAEIPIHDYAPDVCVIDGALWFSASRGGMNGAFYHSPDPIHVPFEKVPASFEFWDPHLFQDEDGCLYFFWGCSNTSPIWGVELEKETMKPLCAPVGLIWGQPERHGFERFGDWPRAMDAPVWSDPEWMLLSYGKPVHASSGVHPQWAVDENIRSWWSADASDPHPQLTLDLEQDCMVHGVQINYADDALRVKPKVDAVWSQFLGVPRVIEDRPLHTRWLLEGSVNGETWFVLEDKRTCDTDLPHDLVVKEEGVQARYIRLTVTELPYHQTARISGLRVFGISQGKSPEKARILDGKRLPLDGFLRWESSKGGNACICWGYAPDKLYHSKMVFGHQEASITALIKGQPAWVRVDCFNEHGVTRGDVLCFG